MARMNRALDEAEQRMIAGLDRIAKELRSVRRVQQAQFAFIDTLVKVILTCLPEPGGEVYTQAKSPRDGTIRRILKERRQGHGWRFKGSAGRIGPWPRSGSVSGEGRTAGREESRAG